jgi:hypothetical protein
MKTAYPLNIKDGETKFANEGVALAYAQKFASLANNDKLWGAELIIVERKKKRSLSANAYYWGVVNRMIAEYLDMDKDELHYRVLLPVFGPESISKENTNQFRFHTDDGQVLDFEMRGQGSSKMDPGEFWKFTETVKKWASAPPGVDGRITKTQGLALYIPDPEKAIDYYQQQAHEVK